MSADSNFDNKMKIKILFLLALVFSLGFASGYYYISGESGRETITFEDKSADCSALFEQNAVVSNDAGNVSQKNETAQGTVLSSTDTKAVAGSEAVSGQFAASKNSTLYHTRNCQYVKRIKAENIVWFASAAEAEAAGKSPHSCTSG